MNRAWILGLLIPLTACGGGDGGDDAVSTASPSAETSASSSTADEPAAAPEDELERAYRTYIQAFLTGDGATAYGLLSERCRDAEPLSEFAAISESAAELYGEVDYEIESVTIDGDQGRVNATYAVDALNSGGGSVWVNEDGAWRSDKCD